MIAHCDTQFERKNVKSFLEKKSNTLIMIGPEGDFSPSEIQLAYQTGFSGVSLSNSRLRTETAGIVATDYVSYLNF